jgi:hypothetical protein
MATPAQLLAQIATAVEAQISGIVRLGSDYRDDLEAIPAGGNRYQLRGGPARREPDTNADYTIEAVELTILHRLADRTDERAYTEGNMQSDIDALIDFAFWRDLAATHELNAAPSYEVSRVGSVIVTTLALEIAITP